MVFEDVRNMFEDIKNTCFSKVAGSDTERIFYRFLSIVSFIAFLVAIVNIGIKAQTPITDVTIETVEAFPWPVMFFCRKRQIDDLNFRNLDTSRYNQEACRGAPVMHSLDLTSQKQLKTECLEFSENTELTKELEHRFNQYSTEFNRRDGNPTGAHTDDWKCVTLNEDGNLASTPSMHQFIKMRWTTSLQFHQKHDDNIKVFSGILDPKLKTFTEQTKNGLVVYEIGVVNTKSQIDFTVDQMVEKDISEIFTSSKIGAKAKQLGEIAMKEKVQEILKDPKTQLRYNPSVNMQPNTPVTTFDGSEQESELTFAPLNYISRIVTTRYKTWDEIWAEIGGTWATAVLLITAFFVGKTVEDPYKKKEDAEPLDEVQVFRLRGVSSKQEAIKTLYGITCDALAAGKENKEQTSDVFGNVA